LLLKTTLEELKQKYDAMCLELDKARRTIQDQSYRLGELQIKCEEVDAARTDNVQLSSKLVHVKSDAAARDRELTLQVETLRHQKATLERELQATREKVGTHRSSFETVSGDLSRLRAEYDTLLTERDRLKRALEENANQHAEQAIFNLQREVEEQLRDVRTQDEERTAKDKIIQQVTAECSKEREKVTILKMQVATLEDKLRVANQELSVFRGIDVYHSTMQAQLNSYRRDRSFNDSALDVSAIRGEGRAERTDRDLGSAFANSINLASAQRPPSRNSRATSFDADSDGDDGPYRAEPPRPMSGSPTPNGQNSRVALSSSPPILRPAAQTVSAPVRVSSTAPPHHVSAPIRSASAERRARYEETDTRSVTSETREGQRGSVYERGFPAEESKSDGRPVHDSNIFSFTRPIPRSPTNIAPTGPGPNESIIVDDTPVAAQAAGRHAGTGDLEEERRELLRRRAERKAIRDQQLRERILREGGLNNSFSASRAAAAADVRDDLSQSSAGSAASGMREHAHRQELSRPTRGPFTAPVMHSHTVDTPVVTAQPSRRHTLAAAPRSGQRDLHPAVGISRVTDVAQRTAVSNAHLTTAAVAAASAPAPYRPRVPDYARARSLLNM
jgi:predicted  nucleic acid-binding Zn-ribbon protein